MVWTGTYFIGYVSEELSSVETPVLYTLFQ